MTTGSVSPRRADTRRNHERILTVAAEELTTSGEVSFNAIAKKAKVGVGTVYRHFPTAEALILAVYEREVRQLVDVAHSLLGTHTPAAAFRVWVAEHLARSMMTKRGLAKAFGAATAASDRELPSSPYDAIVGAVAILLEANVEAGTIRAGLAPATVMRGLGGLFHLDPKDDWRAQSADLADLLWRGMRAE